jgi:hypothetical protein
LESIIPHGAQVNWGPGKKNGKTVAFSFAQGRRKMLGHALISIVVPGNHAQVGIAMIGLFVDPKHSLLTMVGRLNVGWRLSFKPTIDPAFRRIAASGQSFKRTVYDVNHTGILLRKAILMA